MAMPITPEEVPRLFAEAWNAKDADALAGLFAQDADFVNVVGLWWQTKADIKRAHAYGLRSFFVNSQLLARRIKVRQIGNSAAIVHVHWKLTGQTGPAGEALDPRHSVMVFVLERSDKGWIVLAAQNTDIIAGSESLAAKDGQVVAVDYRK